MFPKNIFNVWDGTYMIDKTRAQSSAIIVCIV